jgi:hypothetical protein
LTCHLFPLDKLFRRFYKPCVRLLIWYVAAIYIFGPLFAAPFTGGASLSFYLLPFFVFDFTNWNNWVMGCWTVAGWLGTAGLLFGVHQFIRLTVRHHMRKYRAKLLFQQSEPHY